MEDLPIIGTRYTERLTIPVDKSLKDELVILKRKHDLNYVEWVRRIIAKELPNLKKQLEDLCA